MKILNILIVIFTTFSCVEQENFTLNTYENIISTSQSTYNKNKQYNKDYTIVIDYSIHSGLKRGFLFKNNDNTLIESFLVAHGGGSGEKDGLPNSFSNQHNSNQSSLGVAVLNGRDYSNWGINIKYWIKGLESSNSNLEKRVVVLHSWEGIPDYNTYPLPIAQSQGCPTVSNNTMIFLDSFIKSQSNKNIIIIFKN